MHKSATRNPPNQPKKANNRSARKRRQRGQSDGQSMTERATIAGVSRKASKRRKGA